MTPAGRNISPFSSSSGGQPVGSDDEAIGLSSSLSSRPGRIIEATSSALRPQPPSQKSKTLRPTCKPVGLLHQLRLGPAHALGRVVKAQPGGIRLRSQGGGEILNRRAKRTGATMACSQKVSLRDFLPTHESPQQDEQPAVK